MKAFPLGPARRRVIDTHKDTQFGDAWLVLAILLLLAGVLADTLFLTGAALLLLVVAGVGRAWAAFCLTHLTYQRELSEVRAFRGEVIELRLVVHNRKLLPVTWLNVRDIFPAGLAIGQREILVNPATNLAEFSSFWMPGPYRQLTRRFQVECTTRGFHRFGPAYVTSGDGFGFFNRTLTLPTQQRLIVYPRLYTADELRLPTRNPFGDRRSRGRLFEDPLRTAGVRGWQSADGLRRVHWKATARYQQLLSRVYEPSEEQVVLLFLNVATLERHWHGYIPELQERTISVAGSLAAVALEHRQPVGLMANGALPGSDQPIRLLPGRSPDQLVRLLELLAAVTPFATQPIEQMLLADARRMPWGATVVVVTAIAHGDLLAALIELADAGRRVVLFTLAEQPPTRLLPNVTVYHMPHLVDDLILPQRVVTADEG